MRIFLLCLIYFANVTFLDILSSFANHKAIYFIESHPWGKKKPAILLTTRQLWLHNVEYFFAIWSGFFKTLLALLKMKANLPRKPNFCT